MIGLLSLLLLLSLFPLSLPLLQLVLCYLIMSSSSSSLSSFAEQALAYTCYQMYARQKTGLAPEMVNFENGKVSWSWDGSIGHPVQVTL